MGGGGEADQRGEANSLIRQEGNAGRPPRKFETKYEDKSRAKGMHLGSLSDGGRKGASREGGFEQTSKKRNQSQRVQQRDGMGDW